MLEYPNLTGRRIDHRVCRFISNSQTWKALYSRVGPSSFPCHPITDPFRAVYSKEGRSSTELLESIKNALKALADINGERTISFPLRLDIPSSGISRFSAHLHFFHHQCIILNVKLLLYRFLQGGVDTEKLVRVPSTGGVRSLLRVCVGSARQTTKILDALQAQSLIGTFTFSFILFLRNLKLIQG